MEFPSRPIEEQRLENIKRNHKLLTDMGLHRELLPDSLKASTDRSSKKRKSDVSSRPSRSSTRIRSAPSRPVYTDSSGERYAPTPKTRTVSSKTENNITHKDVTKERTLDTHSMIPEDDVNTLRAGWTNWKPTGPPPTRDEDATFHFSDHPLFMPNKSPEEMIREGCFGGSYFRPLHSKKLGITVSGDWRELPEEWISGLNVDTWLTSHSYNPDINKYKVSCGQSIEEWEEAGWINHTYDVRGWFQWYCRFFMGRRCEDDARQISRWRKCVGETGRWRRMLLKKYRALNIKEVFDDGENEEQVDVSPVMHQTCTHWAFEVRQNVLDEYWRTGK